MVEGMITLPELMRLAETLWHTGRRSRTPAATRQMDLALPQRRLLQSAPKPSAGFPGHIDHTIASVNMCNATCPFAYTFPRYVHRGMRVII